jgi:hypothetical protein
MGTLYGPLIITSNLLNLLDAADKGSYVGTGTQWVDLINRSSVTISNLKQFIYNGLNTISASLITKPFTLSSNMTFEVYYRTETTGSGIATQANSPGIFQIGNYAQANSFTIWDWSVGVSLLNNHSIRTYINNGAVWSHILSSTKTYTDSEWVSKYHHLVAVFSGSIGWDNYKLYIDGVLQQNQNLSPTVTTIAGGNNVVITGAAGGATNNTYAVLRVYNRGFTQNDVLYNYNVLKGRF